MYVKARWLCRCTRLTEQGLDAVKQAIAAAVVAPDDELDTRFAAQNLVADWPAPQPLGEPLEAEPYPDDALPGILGEAVR